MTITERMLSIMKDQKLKSIDLATMLGIGKSSISTWKSRNTNPPSEYIVQICEFLNVNLTYLLTGQGEKRPSHSDPPDPRQLKDYQQTAADIFFDNLTPDQAALINCYEKLNDEEKEEIWLIIKYKLEKKPGLSSNSVTSKDGDSGSTKTA